MFSLLASPFIELVTASTKVVVAKAHQAPPHDVAFFSHAWPALLGPDQAPTSQSIHIDYFSQTLLNEQTS
jgi:hypothetical protein